MLRNLEAALAGVVLKNALRKEINKLDIVGMVLNLVVSALNGLKPIKIVVNDQHTLTIPIGPVTLS